MRPASRGERILCAEFSYLRALHDLPRKSHGSFLIRAGPEPGGTIVMEVVAGVNRLNEASGLRHIICWESPCMLPDDQVFFLSKHPPIWDCPGWEADCHGDTQTPI